MVSSGTLFVVACLASAVLVLPLVPQVYRKRGKPGGRGLLVFVLGASLFSASVGLIWSDTGFLVQFVGRNLAATAASALAVGIFLAIAEYTGSLALTRRVVLVAAAYPTVVTVAAWTNPLHHLYEQPLFEGLTVVAFPAPVVLFAHLALAYLLGGLAWLLIVREYLRSRGTRRLQSLALTVGSLPPFLVNLAFFFDWTAFNLTPLGFVATALVLWWALVRADFLDIVPVGRSRAVESMDDPVVTVDTEGRVVDSNAAARELAGRPPAGPVHVAEFFADVPAVAAALEDGATGTVNAGDGGTRRWFDLDRSAIYGPQGERRGTIVVLREITRLKRREAELDLLRQIQSRVLRHNIRNDLGVITAQNEILAANTDGELRERAETAIETADDLLAVSNKTRDVERLLDADWESTTVDLDRLLQEVIERQRDATPDVTFELDCPDSDTVETVRPVELALDNLVENAAVHNDAPDPWVRVSVDSEDGAVDDQDGTVVTIVDNGPGIPQQELAVRERGEETQLEHGRGVGLWIVDWVCRRSSVTVAFETGDDGTTVRLHVPE